jgi:hypothetical protein
MVQESYAKIRPAITPMNPSPLQPLMRAAAVLPAWPAESVFISLCFV